MSPIRLAWRREARALGLRSVGQGERGWELWCAGERIGDVKPRYLNWGYKKAGYYWTAGFDTVWCQIPLVNTADAPVPTIEEAIARMEVYVKEYLQQAKINRAALTKAGIKIPEITKTP